MSYRLSSPQCFPLLAPVVAVAMSLVVVDFVAAQTSTWTSSTSTNWSVNANWSPASGFPNSATAIANFTSGATITTNVHLTQAITLQQLNFNTTGYTFSTADPGFGITLLGAAPTLSTYASGAIPWNYDLSALTVTIGNGVDASAGLIVLQTVNNSSPVTELSLGNLTVTNNATLEIQRVSLNSGGSGDRINNLTVKGTLLAMGNVGLVTTAQGYTTLSIGTFAGSGRLTVTGPLIAASKNIARANIDNFTSTGGLTILASPPTTGGAVSSVTTITNFSGPSVIDQSGGILTIHNHTGTGAITLTGGTLTLGGSNIVAPLTMAGSGTLLLGNGAQLNSSLTLSANFFLGASSGAIGVVATPLVSDAFGATIVGPGTVVYGVNNTYTGGTTIAGGAVRIGPLAADAFQLKLNNGNVRFNAPAGTSAALETSGTLTNMLGTGAAQIQWLGSGGFSAAGSDLIVRLNNAPTQTMAWGATSFVPAGAELHFGSTSADKTVYFEHPLQLSNGARTIRVADGPVDVEAVISGGISSTAAGSGALFKAGAGTLRLASNAVYTLTTTISGGTLIVGDGGTTGTVGGTVNVAANARFVLDRSDDVTLSTVYGSGNFTLSSGNTATIASAWGLAGVINVNSGTLLLGNAGTMSSVTNLVLQSASSKFHINRASSTISINANIEGPGSVEKAGSTLVVFGGQNTFTGAMTLHSSVRVEGGLLTPTVHLAAAGAIITFSSGDRTYAGKILGTGSSVGKAGSGRLVLTGTSDYTAATNITGGELRVDGAIGTGAVSVAAGTVLSGSGTVNGKVTLAATAVLAPGANISGTLGTAGWLTLGDVTGGASPLTAGGDLAFAFDLATVAASDRIVFTNATAAAPSITALTSFVFNPLAGFGNGNYVLMSGYSGALGDTSFANLTQSYSIDFGGTTFGGTLLNNSGSLVLQVTGGPEGPENLTWTGGDGSWATGSGNFGGGTYTDGDAVTFDNSSSVTAVTIQAGGVAPGGMVVNNDVAHHYAFSGGPISGTTGLVKQGVGTLTLAGANTFSGDVTVEGGTLVVNGSTSAAGKVVVESGALLKGSGAVGNVVIETGGGLSPGNSVESLTASNLTLSSGAKLYFEFRNAGGSDPGTDWDVVDLGSTGVLNLGDATATDPIELYVDSWRLDNTAHGGGLGDDFNGFDPQTNYEWLFIKVDDLANLVTAANDDDLSRRFQLIDDVDDAGVFDPLDGNPFSRPTSSAGRGTFSVAWRSGSQGLGLYVQYSSVPEPGSMLLAGLASLGAGWYGRRRARRNAKTSA